MYSYVTKDKKVLDWKYKKFQYGYNFYIGELLIGQIFKPSFKRNGWDAVSWSSPRKNHVNGFISRHKAAEHLIKIYKEEE